MILVIVGLHSQGFERLVKRMDEIAATINEEVIIQLGHTEYTPRNAKGFHFTDNKTIDELYQEADVVVTHGGAGSIMDALRRGKPVVAVPRLPKYGEHKNEHQLDIVGFFSKQGFLTAVYDVNKLEETIRRIRNDTKMNISKYNFGSEKKKLVEFLLLYLHRLEIERHPNEFGS